MNDFCHPRRMNVNALRMRSYVKGKRTGIFVNLMPCGIDFNDQSIEKKFARSWDGHCQILVGKLGVNSQFFSLQIQSSCPFCNNAFDPGYILIITLWVLSYRLNPFLQVVYIKRMYYTGMSIVVHKILLLMPLYAHLILWLDNISRLILSAEWETPSRTLRTYAYAPCLR